jgi:maleylacetoacetate isomerase
MLKLYTYFRSSAAYRVRIALNLKGITYEPHYVHLVRGGGEQHHPPYLALNPQGFVPTLIDGDNVLTQSLAIIEYLEERYPEKPLLPAASDARARVRALAQIVVCDIHPLNNRRVIEYLGSHTGQTEEARLRWIRHWIAEGFSALEILLAKSPLTGVFSHGERPTLADICLAPQVYNALRSRCDLSPYPTIMQIYNECMKLEEFRAASPENQTDAKV